MTTRNRSRVLTPRKSRIWVTSSMQSSLTVTGVAGQVASSAMQIDFEALVGREFRRGDTLSHVYVETVLVHSLNGANNVFPNRAYQGIGLYAEQLAATDFPNLQDHRGDWPAYKGYQFTETTSAGPVAGLHDGFWTWESRGMRTVGGTSIVPRVVTQIEIVPSSGAYVFDNIVTALWLLS